MIIVDLNDIKRFVVSTGRGSRQTTHDLELFDKDIDI